MSEKKRLKYRPEFPARFGRIQDSGAFSPEFFRWYNEEHRHSWLDLLTPGMVYHNQTALILEQRQSFLDSAYRLHPERFASTKLPNQQRFQPRCGSTNRPTQMKILAKFHAHWSQTR